MEISIRGDGSGGEIHIRVEWRKFRAFIKASAAIVVALLAAIATVLQFVQH